MPPIEKGRGIYQVYSPLSGGNSVMEKLICKRGRYFGKGSNGQGIQLINCNSTERNTCHGLFIEVKLMAFYKASYKEKKPKLIIRVCILGQMKLFLKVLKNIKTIISNSLTEKNHIEINRICSCVNIHSTVFIKALYSSDIIDIMWQHQGLNSKSVPFHSLAKVYDIKITTPLVEV